jgi:asparagine synthase (glutamine-hydrolysing)
VTALVALFNRNGARCETAALLSMLGAMPHRASHGVNLWSDGPVGLGNGRWLSQVKAKPTIEDFSFSDGFAVVADTRLDNRESLVGWTNSTAGGASDAKLILSSYRRWGEACVERLTGDFAFAIWDPQRRVLFCARDHFGVKPLCYSVTSDRAAVATEGKALSALPDHRSRRNDQRIADYLLGVSSDPRSTFDHNVVRLPPAHFLRVSSDAVECRPYWTLEADAKRVSNQPVEQFRDLFATAVRRRTIDAPRISAMLSGGLDSSSIACVAKPMLRTQGIDKLPTISLVFDPPDECERPYIDAILQEGGFDPTFIRGSDLAPFDELDAFLDLQEGPFNGLNFGTSRHLYRAATAIGSFVVLDGHGGDETVTFGEGLFRELAASGNWIQLWTEVSLQSHIGGDPPLSAFKSFIQNYSPLWRTMAKTIRPLINTVSPRSDDDLSSNWRRYINPTFARDTDLEKRYRERPAVQQARAKTEAARHIVMLVGMDQGMALEELDRTAAFYNVEARYPFLDKDLIEFCVSLPALEKRCRGVPRLIQKRAMQGILPPSVQWRADKLNFGPSLVRRVLKHHRGLLESVILTDEFDIGAFVDLPEVREAYGRLAGPQTAWRSLDLIAVWRTVALAHWLRRAKFN